jgi:hypothetical protein
MMRSTLAILRGTAYGLALWSHLSEQDLYTLVYGLLFAEACLQILEDSLRDPPER